MKSGRIAAGAAALIGIVVGWSNGVAGGAAVPFEVLTQNFGYYGCPHTRGLECARTEAEWAALWQRTCLPAPVPEVDFQHQMVIAYLMGSQPVIGSHPEVTGVTRGAGELTVAVTDHLACGGFGSPSDPMVFILVHKWPGEVVLDRREERGPSCT